MTNDQSKQKRLLHDLELLLSESGPFGFGIISAQPLKEIVDHKLWEEAGRLIPSKRENEDAFVFEPLPAWYESFPDNLACLRWCGDAEAVRQFRQWAGRASLVLVGDGILPDDTTVVERRSGSVSMKMAVPDPFMQDGRPFLLLKHLVLTIKRMQPDCVRMLRLQRSSHEQPQVIESFIYEGFPLFGGHLAAEAFRVLCNLRGEPRLSLDLEARTVILDGSRYVLPEEHFLVFEAIFSGDGAIVSRTMMRKRHQLLSDDEHLDRKVDDLEEDSPKLYETIDRVEKKGFRILKHYLE